MGSRAVGVTDTATGAGVAEVRARERGITDTGFSARPRPLTRARRGTTLAITAYPANWPTTGSFKVRVDSEVMVVTAGHSTTSLTVTRAQDGTTGAAHTTGAVVAMVMAEQYVIPTSERVVSGRGMVGSFRIVGTAAASPHNLFSLENASGSAVLVAVRSLQLRVDYTAAATAVAPVIRSSRATGTPAGGTAATKVLMDSAGASSSSVTARGGASADGTNAAITGLTAGSTGWEALIGRAHTVVGQILTPPIDLLPPFMDIDPLILRAGETLLAQLVYTSTTDNPATNHYVLTATWDEFTLP
jgi:hypothetical protein